MSGLFWIVKNSLRPFFSFSQFLKQFLEQIFKRSFQIVCEMSVRSERISDTKSSLVIHPIINSPPIVLQAPKINQWSFWRWCFKLIVAMWNSILSKNQIKSFRYQQTHLKFINKNNNGQATHGACKPPGARKPPGPIL